MYSHAQMYNGILQYSHGSAVCIESLPSVLVKKNIYILSGFKLCYYVNFYDIPIKKKQEAHKPQCSPELKTNLKAFYLISGGQCSWIIKMFLIHWDFCTLLWDDYTWFYLEDVEIYRAVFDVDALYCYFLPTRDILC